MQTERELSGYPSIDLPQSRGSKLFERKPFVPNVDIVTILKLLSRKTRNNPAIDCDNLKATYQELIDDSHTLYLAFKRIGIKKGDIITISLPSNYQAIVSFLALNELGAVTTFIDTYSSEEDIYHYLDMYNSPVFICFSDLKADCTEILKKSNVKHIVKLSENLVDSRDFCMVERVSDEIIDFHSLGLYAKEQKDTFHLPNGNIDSMILYTSGSTGQPKAVVLTNKNILAAQIYAGKTSHTENIHATKTMTCVPLRYPYGMVTSLLTSLLWGKEAIMTPRWDSDTVGYYYGKKPNIVFGSPAVLDVTMRFLPDKMDLSQISHFISGGDFMTEKHAEIGYDFFKMHNCTDVEIGNGCGNAETVSIGSTPVGVPLKQSTAGKVLVGSIPLIIDKTLDDKNELSGAKGIIKEKRYYEEGELCISGKHVFKEYFDEPDKTRIAKFKYHGKEFFRTGTIGYIDEDGYFTPTGRKSRFYIRSTGHKVYMDNVQRLISCIPGIADCAVVKVVDDDELYINWAFVTLQKSGKRIQNLEEKICYYCSNGIQTTNGVETLKEYEIPRKVIVVDSLPTVPGTEKIDYKRLEEQIEEGSWSA
ncbi:class I adenylate-forming enzyme family protein [Butyrivibrio sp. AE2015]|uniref:class I adenylate-forming enzyme family protein n=1 Tax=Butyrivibrio sp. AE2015 TaxID=1280663 RepID=UPI0003B54D49|nr:class I adenylate-forming enzyme family protein [Butyrivibrio sp. AE2015]